MNNHFFAAGKLMAENKNVSRMSDNGMLVVYKENAFKALKAFNTHHTYLCF